MASLVSFNECLLSKYLPSTRHGARLWRTEVNKQIDVVSAFRMEGGGELINRSANHIHYMLIDRRALKGRNRVSRGKGGCTRETETDKGDIRFAKTQGHEIKLREQHVQGWKEPRSPGNRKRGWAAEEGQRGSGAHRKAGAESSVPGLLFWFFWFFVYLFVFK